MSVSNPAQKPLALCFSGCGLLLTYHLGVGKRFLQSPRFLAKIEKYIGTSGGALVAALLCCHPDKLTQAEDYILSGKLLGQLPVWHLADPAPILFPKFIHDLQLWDDPQDNERTLTLARQKLEIITTEFGKGGPIGPWGTLLGRDLKQVRFGPDLRSTEELGEALLASCSFAWDGVECRRPGQTEDARARFWDGGFTEPMPLPKHMSKVWAAQGEADESAGGGDRDGAEREGPFRAITVAPFETQSCTICPARTPSSELGGLYPQWVRAASEKLNVTLPSLEPERVVPVFPAMLTGLPQLYVNPRNLGRIVETTIPRGAEAMREHVDAGYRDAGEFLEREFPDVA